MSRPEDWCRSGVCGACDDSRREYKESQEAEALANPPLRTAQSAFADRVIDVAVRLRSWSSVSEPYTWTQALRDATDIVLASEMVENE